VKDSAVPNLPRHRAEQPVDESAVAPPTVAEWSALYVPLLTVPIPADVATQLARLTADTIAIAYHARRNATGSTGVDDAHVAGGQIAIWGSDRTGDLLSAAFLNGAAAEALDFQEVLIDGRNNGHAAVVIVPAILALAEQIRSDGERMRRALWIAFAANIALARALGRGHRAGEIGFRTTSLTAPIAAALGAAYLLGDDPWIAANAAAIAAASLPAGLLAAMSPVAGDFSMDKDLSVGFSARHALHCTLLAQSGAIGPSAALAGPRSWIASYGFGTAAVGHLRADPLESDLSAYAMKFYPANFGCQCAIRLAIDLAGQVGADEVAHIEVRVKASSAASLSVRDLTTHVAARFSLVYAVASAFIRRRSVLADFERDAFEDETVRSFMDKVAVVGDDQLERRHHEEGIFPARLAVKTHDGAILDRAIDRPQDNLARQETDELFARKLTDLCPAELTDGLLAVCRNASNGDAFVHFLELDNR